MSKEEVSKALKGETVRDYLDRVSGLESIIQGEV